MKRKKSGYENFFAFIKTASAVLAVIFTCKLCLYTPLKKPEESIKKSECSFEIIKENSTDKSKYETPDDIIKLEKEYIEAFGTEQGGKVKEVFYENEGATDIKGKVCIKNATRTKRPDFGKLIEKGAELNISDENEPCVLIYHTHTSESYLLSDNGYFYENYKTRSNKEDRNVIRVGDGICRILNENGIKTVHDKTVYDSRYEGAYARSREGIEKILEDNPSIKITIDIHRDAYYYSENLRSKPTALIDGRKAAQIMIITGTQEDNIKDYPDWEKNLRFALEIQKTAQEKYTGLMKPLYFCPRKYNMDITENSLLIEVGTDANSLDEALYSGCLLGDVLSIVINSHKEEN